MTRHIRAGYVVFNQKGQAYRHVFPDHYSAKRWALENVGPGPGFWSIEYIEEKEDESPEREPTTD